MTAAVLAALLEALKYLWVGRSLHIEKSGRALLQPAQAVIDENISPRNLRLEFDHRRSAGRDQGGLHIAEGSRWPGWTFNHNSALTGLTGNRTLAAGNLFR
jgi:hypothetical protein